MTKQEYDQKFKDVQEIEAQLGYNILERREHHDKDGSLRSVTFYHHGEIVFRQEFPFTERTTYSVHEQAWRRIVYADFAG